MFRANLPPQLNARYFLAKIADRNFAISQLRSKLRIAPFTKMYGQYDGNRSYTSVAQKRVYRYARGHYSTALLGSGHRCVDTYGID